MKLLVVVDKEQYSEYAAAEAARIAINTWADVTILGIQPGKKDKVGEELASMVEHSRKLFLGEASPYGVGGNDKLEKIGNAAWEMKKPAEQGRKTLEVLIRSGNISDIILDQAGKLEADLLVLGSSKGENYEWGGEIGLPRKIAAEANCSVLVIKEEKMPESVVCCLDHDNVSQESLEMINQLVTLHDADLKIVGLAGPKGLHENVMGKMNQVLQYYAARNIQAWVKMVAPEELDAFTVKAAESNLLGVWLGKKSLLQKVFSKDRIQQLVSAADSSIIILK